MRIDRCVSRHPTKQPVTLLRSAASGACLVIVAFALAGVGCSKDTPAQPGAAYVPHPPPPVAPRAPLEPRRQEAHEDADGDGILDSEDFCASDPEDFDGCDDEDGCPDADDDGDGVVDTQDRCPRKSGPSENGGCPVPPKPGTVVLAESDDACLLLEPIHFAPDIAELASDEHPLLEETAACLASKRRLLVLELRGGSAAGEAPTLAAQRARAVFTDLVARGVDPRRLRATTAETSPLRSGAVRDRDVLREKRAVHFFVLRELTCPD